MVDGAEVQPKHLAVQEHDRTQGLILRGRNKATSVPKLIGVQSVANRWLDAPNQSVA